MEIQNLKEEENTKRLADIAEEDDLLESSNIKNLAVQKQSS
jgi:hypothetical protein